MFNIQFPIYSIIILCFWWWRKKEGRKKKKEGGRKDREEWVKKKTLLRSRSAECRGVPNADQWMDSTPF